MKTFWLILSIVCGVTAVGLFLWGSQETAFVLATLGAVAWFLQYRAQLKHEMQDEPQKGAEFTEEHPE